MTPVDFLPDTADQLAANEPSTVWLTISALSPQGDLSIRDVTWREGGRAINHLANWIDDRFGPASEDEPLGFLATTDARYLMVVLAAMKTGYKCLLLSPRNSLDAHVSLLAATGCTKLIYNAPMKPAIDLITCKTSLYLAKLPDVDVLLSPSLPDTAYTTRRRRPGAAETVLILHSSGTTGPPKPVYQRAGALHNLRAMQRAPTPPGRVNMGSELFSSRPMLSMFPMFHVVGVIYLVRSVADRGPLVLLPPNTPPTAEMMLRVLRAARPAVVGVVPSVVEEMARLPGGMDAIATLDAVVVGGAPLRRECGDRIAAVTHLCNGYGTTETMYLPGLTVEDARVDWAYFEWHPLAGIVMEPTGDDGLAELVIQRKPGGAEGMQCVFDNFPGRDEWRTRDLFERHPKKTALWRYHGRLDDLVVLSNGEKVSPAAFEAAVGEHPLVKAALMVGTGKFQTAVAVEVKDAHKHKDAETLREQIWPWIDEANQDLPAHGTVWKEMVLIAPPDKGFIRTPKGTVMRSGTEKLLEGEIGGLYERRDGGAAVRTEDAADLGDVREAVRALMTSVLGDRAKGMSDSTSIFDLGADSLDALQTADTLGRRLGRARIPPRLVYENPSVDRLARVVARPATEKPPRKPPMSREANMSAMIHKYTKDLPANVRAQRSSTPPSTPPSKHTVVLTGSTGTLGTCLLISLLSDPGVEHVYALNRDDSAPARQLQRVREYLEDDTKAESLLSKNRVTFLTASLASPFLGLNEQVYMALCQITTLVIHNAWPVDFNAPLGSFEPLVLGTRNLADFAAHFHAHVVFVSSVASAANYPAVRGAGVPVPEFLDTDNSLAAPQGYGEAKHVASVVLARAAERVGFRATVLRVGQLGGSRRGRMAWKREESIPSLIATSLAMGKLPLTIGSDAVDWLAVDDAAAVIVELALRRGGDCVDAVDCFNVVSPHAASWADVIFPAVLASSGRGEKPLEGVEYAAWVDALDGVVAAHVGRDARAAAARYPAIRLVDFFRGMTAGSEGNMKMPRFATERAAGISRTLGGVRAVDGELMGKWLREWDA